MERYVRGWSIRAGPFLFPAALHQVACILKMAKPVQMEKAEVREPKKYVSRSSKFRNRIHKSLLAQEAMAWFKCQCFYLIGGVR